MMIDAPLAPRLTPAPKNRQKLALVIPTYHEAGNIRVLLNRVMVALDSAGIHYEMIVVDDDSRDGIAELVSAVSRSDPRVRFLVRIGERGLSGAITHGWRHTDAEILGVIDADLQHPPELLPLLFTAIMEGRDLAIGSRYIEGGKLDGWNPVRRLVSLAAACASHPLQQKGLRARDPMSGFFLVRRRCLDGVVFHKSGFKLLLEILVRGRVCSVQEIPFSFACRRDGRSKAGIRVALDYVALLAMLYRERFGFARPSAALTMDH